MHNYMSMHLIWMMSMKWLMNMKNMLDVIALLMLQPCDVLAILGYICA